MGTEGGEGVVAETPKKAKSLAGPLRKKVLEELKTKSVEECLAEARAELENTNKKIEEAAALEESQEALCKDAKHAFDQTRAEVETAMKEEEAAGAEYKAATDKKSAAEQRTQEERNKLMEAQKKLTMLDVMATAFKTRKMAEDSKRRAHEATANAKKAMLEQRQREKDALEATKRALAEARGKRLQQAKPAKVARTDEQDTVPATQNADDID